MPQLLRLVHEDDRLPTLLVTSGVQHRDPLPGMFSLAACRAAQYSVMKSCSKDFGPQGVRCELIDVQDNVQEQGPDCDAQFIAEEAWRLYSQPEGGGEGLSRAQEVYLDEKMGRVSREGDNCSYFIHSSIVHV